MINTLKSSVLKNVVVLIHGPIILLNSNNNNTKLTFKELENVSVRKNKHKKHLHEILTPKEKTERCIFVNRDKNACKNILYLGKYFLKNQSRPIEFCQKSKEKIIVVKQRKPRQKKEIVV